MQLNWSTFILEIINFLILVWLLKRFLYRPVLEAVARRKAAIDKTLSDAKGRQTEAQALQQQYQNRLSDWEKEKEKLRLELAEETKVRRSELMAALERSLELEHEKRRVLEQRRLTELQNAAAAQGISKGVQFTARLLARAASPELQQRLVALVLEDLAHLPDDQLENIRASCKNGDCRLRIISAFPISESERSTIKRRLEEMIQREVSMDFNEDSSLLAGLRISVGPWVLRGNLLDELEFFAASLRYDSKQ